VNGPTDQQPAVRQAAAALHDAQLNLGYTEVKAPQDGVVTKVTQLQVGDYVTAGKPVFTLVGQHMWIEANFKENQLRYMRLGQPAEVEVSAASGQTLKGRVASFSPGTGNAFALLPAENATGNWVKVVQRLPVEIELDNPPRDLPLHAGLSADVTVDTGHQRRLFGPDTPPVQPRATSVPVAR
jgi:membrane fusion protein (multidrug efflux system)